MTDDTPRYGEQPLAQTVAAAGALRRLAGLLLSLEHEHPTVDAMLAQFDGVGARAGGRRRRPTPPADRRRTATDSSACTSTTHSTSARTTRASPSTRSITSTATPPRAASLSPWFTRARRDWCNGGFLAVFFDCVIQHQNCAAGGGQDPLADGDVPQADAHPHRARASTSSAYEDGRQGDVDGAAVCWTTRCCASASSTTRGHCRRTN